VFSGLGCSLIRLSVQIAGTRAQLGLLALAPALPLTAPEQGCTTVFPASAGAADMHDTRQRGTGSVAQLDLTGNASAVAPLPDLASSVFSEPTATMWEPLYELYSLESFLASGIDDGYLTLCKLSPRWGSRANEIWGFEGWRGLGAWRGVVWRGEWS
jgi:hypothetical protein